MQVHCASFSIKSCISASNCFSSFCRVFSRKAKKHSVSPALSGHQETLRFWFGIVLHSLELTIVEGMIEPALGQEFLMGSLLNDLAVAHDED